MSPRLLTARTRDDAQPRRSGGLRFVASLGVFAAAGVGLTAAAVTDSTVAALSPVGATFDVALADPSGALVPDGTLYVVPDADISGAVRPLDTTATGQDASFPLRIVNNSTGSVGAHVVVSFQRTTAADPLDVYSKLQFQVVDPANPATPLLPWTSTAANPAVPVDVAAAARTRTLQVQVRMVAAAQLDPRYYGAPVSIGVTLRGESS